MSSEDEATGVPKRLREEEDTNSHRKQRGYDDENDKQLPRPPKKFAFAKTSSSDRNNNISSSKLTRRDKEALILRELSCTMHTLQHLSNVLEDIVSMTSKPVPPPAPPPPENPSSMTATAKGKISNHNNNTRILNTNIIQKQQALLKELKQWQQLLPSNEED